MRFVDKDPCTKRKYSRISFKKREKLIEDVEGHGFPLSYIAKKLKIKQSTARMILRKYKQSGEFRTKNFKNKRNTDLREWGATKNVQKLEQFHQKHSQSSSGALPSSPRPQPQEDGRPEGGFGDCSPHLYWFYYIPAFDYMPLC